MPLESTYKNTNFRLCKKPENAAIFQSLSSGKEKDVETGYHYFGARYYNSDLSMWLSVDPMSDKYPSLSPYNYCAWNSMNNVDPDGMKIGDPPISRITVQNGYVILNMNNLHNSTRARINAYHNNTKNWPSGYIGAIGPLAHAENNVPELLDPRGGYGYTEPSVANVKTQAVTTKSTKLPDRRVKPHIIASNGTRGGNAVLAAIDIANYTMQAISCGLWNNDMKNINKQLGMMESAFEDVLKYDREIGLPKGYSSPEQMLYISNYVLQKENVTQDPMIKQIGDIIRE